MSTFQTVSFAPSLTQQTWIVPSSVYSFVADISGGGGSGGVTGGLGGGGGGGARAVGTFLVTPGQSVTVVSAKGGIAPTSNVNGNAGQASIVQVGSEILTANGGQGGQGSSAHAGGAGGTASATSGVLNTLLLNGQPGSDGFSTDGGVGGSGANGGAGGFPGVSGGSAGTPGALQGGGGAGSNSGPSSDGADGGVTFQYVVAQQIPIPRRIVKNYRISSCKHRHCS